MTRQEELLRAATQEIFCNCGCEHPFTSHLLFLLCSGAVTFFVFMVCIWKWMLIGEATARHDDITWLRNQLKEDITRHIGEMSRGLWMQMRTLDDEHEAALLRQGAAVQAALLRQGAAIILARHVHSE